MAEVFAFSEGALFLWTGSLTASGSVPLAFVQNVSLSEQVTNATYQTLNGRFHNVETESRYLLSIGQGYAPSAIRGFYRQYVSGTASGVPVHYAVEHSANGVWEKFIGYSAYIDNFAINGSEGQLMGFTLQAHGWLMTATASGV